MSRCHSCSLEAGRFRVEVQSNEHCNYCDHWRNHRQWITDYEAHRPNLLARFEKLSGRSEFDALVGFSGGKDSTYVVKTLRQHGLKVLAFTFDNGFLTDYARENIRAVVEELDVEHFFHRPDQELHQRFYKGALEAYGDPCVGCAVGIYFSTVKIAVERAIPMIVHGRTPYQIFRNYYQGSPDIFLHLHCSNYEEHSSELLARIYAELDRNVRLWLEQMFPADRRTRKRIYREFFVDPSTVKAEQLPDFIGLFQYGPYDEAAIKDELERTTSYKRPEGDKLLGHGDCEIHDIAAHLFRQIHGEGAVRLEVASMLRHQTLSHEQAQRLLDSSATSEFAWPERSATALCAALGLSPGQLKELVESVRERGIEKFPCH
jgi:tRNA(Ile)-lysidine synthase TilS/MesJ